MVRIAGCVERWNRVGVVQPSDWEEAVRAVTSAAKVICPPGGSLTWFDEPCALAVPLGRTDRCLGIRLGAYTLLLVDQDRQLLKTLPLAGSVAGSLGSWLSSHGFDASRAADLPPLPSHAALSNLERTMSNVYVTLGSIVGVTDGAGPVRTDPDTFETTSTVSLPSREGEPPRLITMGLSPAGEQGDLFLRTQPEAQSQSPLRLAMREVATRSDGDAQAGAVGRFLAESLKLAYQAVNREWRARRPPE